MGRKVRPAPSPRAPLANAVHRTPIPILDEIGRVFAVCVGRPNDAGWSNVSRDAAADIAAARGACKFPSGCRKHRRGDFPALAVGVSYGGGQKRPGNLVNSRANARVLRRLLRTRALRRIAGFASGAFAFWNPRLHAYYHDRLGRLFQHHPRLERNFENSVFACATVNFGPQTCCYPHTDANNLPFGLCAVTALGDFNPELGGHLVLWDLRMVIEFPPGSTILIPSATVRHSNTAIQRNETRYSFTQYAAGGLFRWVDHGFQTEKVYQSGWSAAAKKEEVELGKRRWEEGNKLFSTLDELRSMDRSALPCDEVP
ncbi:hypothetical protein FIBSPDRAFT_729233 [Athelia psychrophila]|uniref:Fe2OG dioxygenase domain-containing protein n=1 Tax=Athelia psychrophila TaxID=1759441 RepID=A0A166RKK7_9AGAM|nr:hypothetical protein FIBSPDRAFT_729233 [Fibularhizoctonia sp. CBS 109695]